jgi:hypothetical protein
MVKADSIKFQNIISEVESLHQYGKFFMHNYNFGLMSLVCNKHSIYLHLDAHISNSLIL